METIICHSKNARETEHQRSALGILGSFEQPTLK